MFWGGSKRIRFNQITVLTLHIRTDRPIFTVRFSPFLNKTATPHGFCVGGSGLSSSTTLQKAEWDGNILSMSCNWKLKSQCSWNARISHVSSILFKQITLVSIFFTLKDPIFKTNSSSTSFPRHGLILKGLRIILLYLYRKIRSGILYRVHTRRWLVSWYFIRVCTMGLHCPESFLSLCTLVL